MADVFAYRHRRTDEMIGLVVNTKRGVVNLQVLSRDTIELTVVEPSAALVSKTSLSRRGPDLLEVVAALAGG